MTTIDDQEINGLRHNLELLRYQINSGRVDPAFLTTQIERMSSFMEGIKDDRREAGRAEQFELLYNVSRVLGSSLDLQDVLNQVMDAVIQLTGAERGFLMLRDPDGGLQVQAARNLDQETLSSSKFGYSRTITNRVLDTGEAIVTTNAAEDPRFSGQTSIMSQSIRSIMATPLRARGSVIGVAYVDSSIKAGLFAEHHLTSFEAFAGQAAIAIENARLFKQTDAELAARVEELTQLRRIDRLLNETLDADQAMRYTLEWAVRLADADFGHLGLVEGSHVAAALHHNIDGDAPVMLQEAYPRLARVLETKLPLLAQANDDGVLIVPIMRETQMQGVVIVRRRGVKATEAFSERKIDLVQRVVTRAAVAIENGRLYEAVQAADRAKSEFVGIVAHDLKVPMTSIRGYAELTSMIGDRHQNFVDREAEFLEKITDTVGRMEVLVSDLADISRIESGHFFMEEISVPVSKLVQAVKDNTMTQVLEREHTFVETIEPDLPNMYVDYYRLLQVLTNIVSNAYKYTPNGGTITLHAKRDGERVRFTVEDTGIGLSETQVKMLGTKFWRAEDDFTRSQRGTGLGYAITASLVEQMGSHIDVESEVGKGSRFSFSVAIEGA